jgi:hypothetical protein
MNIYAIGAIVAIVIILIVVIYYYFFAPSSPVSQIFTVNADGPFELSKRESILQSSSFPSGKAAQAFLTEGTGSFQAYIYMDSLSQTGSVSSCGTRPNQPSCSSGLYDPCTCDALVDCRNCTHDGYKNLVSLYGVYNLEVLPFPDASRQNTVSAQIAVQTQTANQAFVETIPLPPIPLQKWVMITISKSGRRVDVYYNATLVVSKTLLNMISTMNPSGTIVQAGDSTLSGTIGVISMSSSSAIIGSVASFYSQSSDTRGAPTKFAISLDSYGNTVKPNSGNALLKTLCLDGSCLYLPKVGNANASLAQFTDSLSNLSSTSSSKVSPAFSVRTDYA